MPEFAAPGNYTFRVEGMQDSDGRGGFVFQNETELLFHPKRVSVFMQTDQPVYWKRQSSMYNCISSTMALKGQLGIFGIPQKKIGIWGFYLV